MNLSNLLWPKSAICYFGEKASATAIESAPVPTPAPPVTSDAPEVIQAQQDLAQQNLLKKSVKKTMLAGDTGGFSPSAPNVAGQPPAQTGYKGRLG